MKKLLLPVFLFTLLSGFPQVHHIRNGLRTEKAIKSSPFPDLQVKNSSFLKPAIISSEENCIKKPNVVSVVPIGTSADAYGYGYSGGQRTMVWADNCLNAIINVHRMGPGTIPPGLSGYIGVDIGKNKGQTPADWQLNKQIYAANMPGSAGNPDAAWFPQGGIFNPVGDTNLSNAYVTFFAPNLTNNGNWGGISHGVANLVNQSDSTKHLEWDNPPPFNYIPDGFAINKNGVALAVDKDMKQVSGEYVYQGNLIVWRGLWNTTLNDFIYTRSVLPLPTILNKPPLTPRVAFSPDGYTAYIVALKPVINLDTGYSIVYFKCTDEGLTWSPPVEVILDGPNGIAGITQHLLSDYRITQIFNPPYPYGDEIAFTTAFDCDLAVDLWGNPHIGVVIGVKGDNALSIIVSDSTFAVYDIFSCDGGCTWLGQLMGYPTTFRGSFGSISEDNRVNVSSDPDGVHLVFTWLDTQITGVTRNVAPDVFARGEDLITVKLTRTNNWCQPDNVTSLSTLAHKAYFATASHSLFTENDTYRIPIVAELLSDTSNSGAAVVFQYIPDFSYMQSYFACTFFPESECIIVKGKNDVKKYNQDSFSNQCWAYTVLKETEPAIQIYNYPNPCTEVMNVHLKLPYASHVQIDISNLTGEKVKNVESVYLQPGDHEILIQIPELPAGVYFCSVYLDQEIIPKKIIVDR